MISQIARASLRSEILMDFDCYIDTEVGLIRLIQDKYLDDKVFNIELLQSGLRNIINMLINRKEYNPLYLFANENISKEDLDDYYKEFMDIEYDNILSRSVTTEISHLIDLFKSEPSIHVTFLCHNQKQRNILVKEEYLKGKNFILDTDDINFSNFTQFFFKYISKDIDKYIFPYKTYYFSKYLLNFDDNFNINYPEIADKIMYNSGEIEILDLYNKIYLKGVQTNEGETNDSGTQE